MKIMLKIKYPLAHSVVFWQIVAKYRLRKGKEDSERVREKFGFASKSAIEKLEKFRKNDGGGDVIWVHAVSVGESLSTIGLIRKICENGYFVLLTTTTLTSARIVEGRLPERAVHQFCPYPSTKYFKRFTSTWKPSKTLFTESEIFPNVVKLLKKKNIPVYLINARMSDNSFNMWKKVRFYIKPVLNCYTKIFPQSNVEANKFVALGYDEKKIKCYGNLKVDATVDAIKNATIADEDKVKFELLKKQISNQRVVVYGSPHKEEFFYLVWQQTMLMRKTLTGCVGIFVPRYMEEVQELVDLFRKNDIEPLLYSELAEKKLAQVIIVDKMGLLLKLYELGDFAVVCGNFAEHIGGHNPIEPVALSKPTLVGPYCEKSKDIVATLLAENAVIQTMTVCEDIDLLIKNDKIDAMKANCKRFMEKNGGAVEKIFESIFLI